MNPVQPAGSRQAHLEEPGGGGSPGRRGDPGRRGEPREVGGFREVGGTQGGEHLPRTMSFNHHPSPNQGQHWTVVFC